MKTNSCLYITACRSKSDRLLGDVVIQTLGQALRHAAHVLSQDGSQLISQLCGCLMDEEALEIKELLAQAVQAQRMPWLRPLTASLRESNALVRSLGRHKLPVFDVALTPNGRFAISASLDNTLKVWDWTTGELVRTL